MATHHILIADDNETLSKLLGFTLEKICPDCRIVIVPDGLTALAKVQHQPTSPTFDLIFTDYEMPGMNGLELARAVYEIHPDIKIALITGHRHVPGLNGDGRPKNLISLLEKPFRPDEIEQVFNLMIDHSRNHEENRKDNSLC